MDFNYTVDQIPEEENEGNQKYFVISSNKVAQQFVRNVYKYFRERHPNLSPLQETAAALQISTKTIKKYKDGPQKTTLSVTKRRRKKPLTDDLKQASREDIRNEIYTMYSERKGINEIHSMHAERIPVTLKSLLCRLRTKEKYEGSKISLLKVMRSMGFSYKKDDNRRALMEKPHVANQRRQFLKRYMENEALGAAKKPYVFIDETWVFSNGSFRKSWQDEDVRSVRKESGEGNRYIVLHAGNENGFIDNASLIFKSKTNKGDYHGEMNAENFENWMKNALLPSLTEPSILILDNASYHSRQVTKWPTKSWSINDMKDWLTQKNIDFPPHATKEILWSYISQVPREKCYAVESLIHEAGHEVLRLPPYHCHFNAIEMVWSQAKRLFDQLILKEKDVIETWKKSLEAVSPQQWCHYVCRTDKIIKAQWQKEKYLIVQQQPLIIQLGNDDSSDSD